MFGSCYFAVCFTKVFILSVLIEHFVKIVIDDKVSITKSTSLPFISKVFSILFSFPVFIVTVEIVDSALFRLLLLLLRLDYIISPALFCWLLQNIPSFRKHWMNFSSLPYTFVLGSTFVFRTNDKVLFGFYFSVPFYELLHYDFFPDFGIRNDFFVVCFVVCILPHAMHDWLQNNSFFLIQGFILEFGVGNWNNWSIYFQLKLKISWPKMISSRINKD